MSRVANKLIAAAAGAGADTGDDDFANVVLLLDGDGTNGAANNTFTDSSTNSETITKNGSVVQGSFSPYGDNWSNYFEGSNDYFTFSSVTAAGTGDVTVEFWFWASDETVTYRCIYDSRSTTGTDTGFGIFQYGKVIEVYGNGKKVETAADAFNGNEWVHFALVRSSGSCQIYINGTASGSSATYSDNLTSTARIVGDSVNTSFDYYGYISNLRETHTAVYTSNFTAPTAPFAAITGTKILTCSSNRFEDESTNGYSATIAGTPKVTPFSPFKNDDARDITTDGGSAYFNLSDAYLTYAGGSASASRLTISFWIYVTGSMDPNNGLYPRMFNSASNEFLIYTRSDDIRIYNGGEKLQTPINKFEWRYFVAQLNDFRWEMWLDGVSKGTNTSTGSNINLSSTNYIARDETNAGYFGGYLCDVKITEGAEYDGGVNFTPPTSPVGATLGSAYTINSLSYENKEYAHGNDSNPQGVAFKSDGTKMYIVGATNDSVFQYSLSTAWDVSTASYDSVSLDVSSEDATPTGLAFSPDGTKMYISGNTNDKIFQYTLSTAWDLSTASYASKSLSLNNTSVGDVFIHPSGTSIYDIDNAGDVVNQYDMTTAFDVSTASYTQQVSVSTQESIPVALAFSSDGTKMFVAGQSGDDINQYSLSTGFDISTASFDNITFATNSQSVNPAGLAFKDDGTKLYMISNTADKVFQYSVFSSPDVLLNFQDAGIYDYAGINNVDTVGNAQIDTSVKKYGTGSIQFDGNGDYIEASYVGDLFDFDTGDWTLECWVYLQPDTDSAGGIIEIYSDDNNFIRLFRAGGPDIQLRGSSGGTQQFDIQSSAQSQNTWIHVAGVRDGSTIRLFVNGTQVGTDTSFSIPDLSDARVLVGLDLVATDRYFTGYIDDLRITKGIARYTADFTPPTAELPKF